MNIEIRYRAPMRMWQRRLADVLRADSHNVKFLASAGRKRLPVAVVVALAAQKTLFGPSRSLFDRVDAVASDPFDLADVAIALDGEAADAASVLEPLFDGRPGDVALVGMLARDGEPAVRIRLRHRSGQTDIVTALLAVEDRDVLSRALDAVLARLVTLLAQAVRRMPAADVRGAAPPAAREIEDEARALKHMASGLVRKMVARAAPSKHGPAHWRIGYRRPVQDEPIRQSWPTNGFTIIEDDGMRFYADPMPFTHEGGSFVFFEDFPYATGKGVIGVVEIGEGGQATRPRTVLEQPFHLSYPLLVEHGGAIYMLPEMSAARRVQLFRADPFPDRWSPDRILVEDRIAADATPILHQGRWWLFATLSDDGGSTWDALGLFHAPDLFGPWTPHPDNPVLLDAGAARPAGAMWHEDGVLMRVAQDCRGGYGRGLAICRVDRLDEQGYAQTVVARLGPPAGSQADGIHTLNRDGTLEVIDLRYPYAARFGTSPPGSSSRTGT